MDKFIIKTYEEESKMSLEEKKKYYQELKQNLLNSDYSFSKKTYLNLCEKLNKKITRKIIDEIKGYKLIIKNSENIPNEPVIFVSSHQDLHDHFNIILAISRHCIILNSCNVPKIIKIIMSVNGIEYVDRKDKKSRFTSKINLMEYLAKNKSIVVFPEATFNCSPNKLILPLHSGVIDIAKKMQVPIVPLVQEYNYDILENNNSKINSCIIKFGNPIYVSLNDNIQEKKEELRESMATIRFELISRKGTYQRNQILNEEYINILFSKLNTMDLMKVTYDEEKKSIYGYNEWLDQDYPINAVQYNINEELLTSKALKKIKFKNKPY